MLFLKSSIRNVSLSQLQASQSLEPKMGKQEWLLFSYLKFNGLEAEDWQANGSKP